MEILERFLQHLDEKTNLANNTRIAYTHDVGNFLGYLRDRTQLSLEEITPQSISHYLLQLQQEGKSASTISRNLAAVRAFCLFMGRQGFMAGNPAREVPSPKVKPREPRILTVDEISTLMSQPDPKRPVGKRDKAILEVLYATGLRVSELVGLNTDDVVVGLEYLRCVEGGGRERVIPVGRMAVEALKEYLEKARPYLVVDSTERALFVNTRGQRLTRQGCWKIVKSYAVRVGLENTLTPHTLRHSFAMHLLENGADLHSVQELLGHASISTTQVYSRLAKGKLREVYTRTHPRA